MNTQFEVLAEARSIFDKEIEALVKTRDALGADFEKLVELVLRCRGKVILTGMGKPGHIGTKIAARRKGFTPSPVKEVASYPLPAYRSHLEGYQGDSP